MNKQINTYEIDQAFSDFCLKHEEGCAGCKYENVKHRCFDKFVEDNYIIERRNNEQTTI